MLNIYIIILPFRFLIICVYTIFQPPLINICLYVYLCINQIIMGCKRRVYPLEHGKGMQIKKNIFKSNRKLKLNHYNTYIYICTIIIMIRKV